MSREFHILVSAMGTRFTLKELGTGAEKVFSSLFEAARHARASADRADGVVVISDPSGNAINRIPLNVNC